MKITFLQNTTFSRPGQLLQGKKGQTADWPDDAARSVIAEKRAKAVATPKPKGGAKSKK